MRLSPPFNATFNAALNATLSPTLNPALIPTFGPALSSTFSPQPLPQRVHKFNPQIIGQYHNASRNFRCHQRHTQRRRVSNGKSRHIRLRRRRRARIRRRRHTAHPHGACAVGYMMPYYHCIAQQAEQRERNDINAPPPRRNIQQRFPPLRMLVAHNPTTRNAVNRKSIPYRA